MNQNFDDENIDIARRAFLGAAATALAAAGIIGCSSAPESAPKSAPKSASDSAPKDSPSETGAENPAQAATANVQKITDTLFLISGGAKLQNDEALPFVIPTTSEPGVILRDRNGKLHAMSARCTHVGCVVAWKNNAQHLACPCHNSQFDLTGKVLGGPASKPLPQWKIETKGDDAMISI